jgi:hypothetical protein
MSENQPWTCKPKWKNITSSSGFLKCLSPVNAENAGPSALQFREGKHTCLPGDASNSRQYNTILRPDSPGQFLCVGVFVTHLLITWLSTLHYVPTPLKLTVHGA